jgi:hypothetical protein
MSEILKKLHLLHRTLLLFIAESLKQDFLGDVVLVLLEVLYDVGGSYRVKTWIPKFPRPIH